MVEFFFDELWGVWKFGQTLWSIKEFEKLI